MAARGINKVILIGNMGNDPEVRYMPSGDAFANITIATNESWKDKTSGEQHNQTEWHNIVLFGRLAEIAGEYLKKGSKIYIEGKLRTRKWKDKAGQDRQTTEIVARDMQMLDSRGGGAAASASGFQSSSSSASNTQEQAPIPAGTDDFDDDIPF